jgi:hypothetical protein
MKDFSPNHYEQAFESWLTDNHIQYIKVDEHKKAAFGQSKVKSFDFLLYPPNAQGHPAPIRREPKLNWFGGTQQIIIAEVKGRLFKGTSFAKLTGFECWVTTEDIDGLTKWQKIFGRGYLAVFIFAYKIENVDVDFDGREVFDYNADRYVFFAVKLDDYREFMKRRSPKWKTVTLPANKFRQCTVQVQDLLL